MRQSASPSSATTREIVIYSTSYPATRVGILSAMQRDMKMNTTLLSYISKEISNGRPLWGLLRANEYLEANCPIRRALAKKAQVAFIARNPSSLELVVFEMATNGKKLSDFSEELQLTVRQTKEVYQKPAKRYSFVPPTLEYRREIRAMRSGNG